METISYTYDAAGNLLTASDNYATYAYEYDGLGRVVEETQTIAGLSSVIVLTYEYDAVGNMIQAAMSIGGVADAVTDYTYDNLGRVTMIEQYGVAGGNAVAEKRVDITYDAADRYATISYYSDLDGGSGNLVMTAAYTYDDVGQLTDLVYTDASSSTLRDFEWVYDAIGCVTSHDSDIASEDVTLYTYDATGQLLSVDYIDYYHKTFKETTEASVYLQKRGITVGEAINHFRVGNSTCTLHARIDFQNLPVASCSCLM